MPKLGLGRRVTALVLGAWLSAAVLTTGCYTMSADPPRDVESKRALRALKRHLRVSLPGAKFYIEQLPVSVPGWTLFAGELRSIRHGDQHYWVVRADGSVVTKAPIAELSRIYRRLEAVRPESLASPQDLAWIAVALLEQDQRLFDQRLSERQNSEELVGPQLVRQGDAAILVFWVYTVGRGMYLSRYELRISAEYEVTVSVTRKGVPIGHFDQGQTGALPGSAGFEP